MLVLKLGLLTCAFYVGLTALLEAGLWALVYSKGGFSVFVHREHWFWTVGLRLGVIFGILWVISFSAAWWITYQGLKSKFPVLPN